MKKSTAAMSAIAVSIAVYSFFINPFIDEKRAETRELLEQRYAALQKYEMFVSGRAEGEVKKVGEKLKRLEKGVLSAPDISLASARLQSRVQDIAEGAGLSVLSIKTGTHTKLKGYAGFPLEIEGAGSASALSAFLKSLDSGGDFIRIDRLDISAGGAGDETLRIRIQLTGLARA